MLNKDQILNAEDLKRKEVDVPEWGGSVYIQELDAASYEKMIGISQVENRHAFLLVRCITDSKGVLLFTPEDIDALGKKNYKVLDRLADEVLELSELSDYKGKEREKNLKTTR